MTDQQLEYEIYLAMALARNDELAKDWRDARWTLPAIHSDGILTEFKVTTVEIGTGLESEDIKLNGVCFHLWRKEFQHRRTGFSPTRGIYPIAQMTPYLPPKSVTPTLEGVTALLQELAQDEGLSDEDRQTLARAIESATHWKQAA
jgi:hypothetical protein